MAKKINYGIQVVGDEDQAKVIYSKNITHMQLFALLKHLLDSCYGDPINNVPESRKIEILDKMVADAKEKAK